MVSTLKSNRVSDAPAKVWFFNAPVDLFVCCGGLLWMVVAIHSLVSFPSHREPMLFSPESSLGEKALFYLLYTGGFLVTYPHNLASVVRVYGSKASFKKYQLCGIMVPALTAALLVGAAVQPSLIPWYVRVTVIWNVQHWVAQCYGLGLLYCSRASFSLSKVEKNLLWTSCQVLILWAAVKVLAFPETQAASFCGVPITPIAFVSADFFQWTEQLCLGTWGAIAAVLTYGWAKSKRIPPLAMVALFATIFRITMMSYTGNVDLWLFGLPLFHALQYLVLTSRYHAKEQGIVESPEIPHWKAMLASNKMRTYYGGLVASGAALYLGLPLLLRGVGLPIESATALTFLLLNFQHILTDAFIWRLRDPAVRSNL